jgi:hypothetical protein
MGRTVCSLWSATRRHRAPYDWRGGAARKAMPWKQVLREWNEANPGEHYCLSGIQKAYKEASNYLAGEATTTSRRRGRSRGFVSGGHRAKR